MPFFCLSESKVSALYLANFLRWTIFTSTGLSFGRKILSAYTNHYLQWPHLLQAAIVVLAILFFAFAWAVRYFVVEYVGDVAIYISSYKVSRFDTIRKSILEEACTVARQIYSAGISDKTELPYDSVVIVGHSLGSVISYDTLNRCINWDQVECNFERQVVPRTTRFITFGSPLDKTAFLFRTQVSSARNLREALAARQQPLILDYQKFRPLETFRWINIHAPADIISGHLDYYDAKDVTGLTDINPVGERHVARETLRRGMGRGASSVAGVESCAPCSTYNDKTMSYRNRALSRYRRDSSSRKFSGDPRSSRRMLSRVPIRSAMLQAVCIRCS